MSNFFTHFPNVNYAFGDEFNVKGGANLTLSKFQDISAYIDLIDEVKLNAPFYSEYYVLENDRPDQVSQAIYGTPDYHWTFFIMNDHIRNQGWPLSLKELEKKVKRDFPHKYFTTLDDLTGIMKVGQRCFASISSGGGTILRRNLDIGLVVVDSKDQFQKLENVSNTSYEGVTKTVTTIDAGFEYNAPHHYEDVDGNYLDIDPSLGPDGEARVVTYYDHYVRQNDALKQIKVIRPDAIQEVVGSYLEALKS